MLCFPRTPKKCPFSHLYRRMTAQSRPMTIRYPHMQSTDEHAFDDLPPSPALPAKKSSLMKQPSKISLPQSSNMAVTAKSAAQARKAAMEGLQERVESKAGGGKLKGKVGIITGVGPSTGIGVSQINLCYRRDTKTRRRLRKSWRERV